MENITKTTFEFNRMTSEPVPEYKFTYEQLLSSINKQSGYFRGDIFYGKTL